VYAGPDDLSDVVIGFGRSGARTELGRKNSAESGSEIARVIQAVVDGGLWERRLVGASACRWTLTFEDGTTMRGGTNWSTGWTPPWRTAEEEQFQPW
jgi:hypothetical protein